MLIVPQTPLPVGFEGNKTFGFIYELNKFRISFDERAETVEQSKILTEVETLYNWFKARIASSTDLDDKTAVIMTFEDLLENHKKDLRKLQKEWEKQKTQQKTNWYIFRIVFSYILSRKTRIICRNRIKSR